MIKARVYVLLKPHVVDSQSNAINVAAQSLGFKSVMDIRANKYFELVFKETDKAEVERQIKEICQKLLINQSTEKYAYELVKFHD